MRFKNALIVFHNKSFKGTIELDDSGNVLNIIEGEDQKPGIDCSNLIIMPGFIDSHTHGGYGFSFDDLNNDNFKNKFENYLEHLSQEGVVAVVGTTVTAKIEELKNISLKVNSLNKTTQEAIPKIVAWYFEGPFISKAKKGAHEEQLIIDIDEEFLIFLKEKLKLPTILTVAPENGNNQSLINKYKNDFIFALGHSNANYLQSKNSLQNGINRITHLYNAMSGFHHHDLGIVNAIFNKEYKENLAIEIITDSVHVDNEVILYSYNNFDIKNINLVSDSLSPKGFPDGEYQLGNLQIEKRGNWFYLKGTKTLSGSAIPYNSLVQNFYNVTKCSLEEIVSVSSYNSARNLNLPSNYGNIIIGKKANIVFLDKDLNFINSIIDGKLLLKNKFN
ncbi:MAG: N-acetylglucosamine-6-phosphate deacetylase [Metamycoplasmataceae bacterium]